MIMKTEKVISTKNLPVKMPIWSSITAALALDHWNAPEWLWGAVGLFFILGWVVIIISMVKQEKVDVFEYDIKDQSTTSGNSKFQAKLKKALTKAQEQ